MRIIGSFNKDLIINHLGTNPIKGGIPDKETKLIEKIKLNLIL